MRHLWRIAKTEVLEHRRQPWMLFILVANYLLWGGVFGVVFFFLDVALTDPQSRALVEQQLRANGVELGATVKLATSTFGSLLFTNLPLFVAIMSGSSVMHERECGALPFLMLAPVTRLQLLIGKLAGAMAFPLLFHFTLAGSCSLLVSQLPVVAPYAAKLGGSSAWWVAFLLGAPASAAFVGALGTVISALARDVRTSMQFTSFFIGILSLGIGYVLIDGTSAGVPTQLTYAAGCLVGAFVIAWAGSKLISRDLAA